MADKYFYLDPTPTIQGKFLLRVNHDLFYCKGTTGSYNILPARLLNISYANFLRFCRDDLGATLYGKNTRYPIAYFELNEQTRAFVKLLNSIAAEIVFEKEHPDYQEHKAVVDAYYQQLMKEQPLLTTEELMELVK